VVDDLVVAGPDLHAGHPRQLRGAGIEDEAGELIAIARRHERLDRLQESWSRPAGWCPRLGIDFSTPSAKPSLTSRAASASRRRTAADRRPS